MSLREEEEQIQWVVEVGAVGLGLLMLGLHRVIVLCETLIQEGFRAIGFSRVRVRAKVFSRGSSSSDLQRAKARKARSLKFFTHTVSRGPAGTNRLGFRGQEFGCSYRAQESRL